MTITNPQRALLHVVKAKLGWTEEVYRQVLVRIAGVTSLTDLDRAGFDAIMAFAHFSGFNPLAKGAPRYGDRPGMASFAQIELVRELWREVHGQRVCDDAALAGWMLKYVKVSSLRFLTLDGARKAITALKAWKARPARTKAA